MPEAPAPQQAPRQAQPGWLLFAALVLATMMGPMALQMFFPAVPDVRAGFGIGEDVAQLTVSLPLFVMAFLTLAYGSLSDRLGRRPVLIGGILLFAAGSALAAMADTIWLLLAGRFVQAAGGACGVALARAIVRDVYGADRLVRMIAWLTMAFALGPMLSVPLGGWLVVGYGWRSVLVFAALAGLAIALCIFLAVAESHPPAARTSGGGVRRLGRDYAALFGNLRLQAFVWQSGATSAAFFVAAPGAATVMVDYLGHSPETYGYWFPLFPVGFLLGNFAAGRLSGRSADETMVLASSLLQALAVAALGLFAASGALQPWMIFVPAGFITFSNGLGLSYAQGGAIRLAGRLAGTAAGIGSFMQLFCGALFLQLFGLLADGTTGPYVLVLGLTTALALTAGGTAFALRSRPSIRPLDKLGTGC